MATVHNLSALILQAAASQYEGAGLQAKEEVALLRKQLREEEEKNRRAERDLRNALTQKEQEVAALEGMLKDLEEELKSAREEMTDLGSEQRNVCHLYSLNTQEPVVLGVCVCR